MSTVGPRTLVAATLLAALVLPVGVARAEDPAFALTTGLAVRAGSVRNDAQLGGSLLFDVWFARGPVRLGGATGIVALFGRDEDTRTFAPVLLSIGVESLGPRFGFSLRFRGGMWAGATDNGLGAGSVLSGGIFLHYMLEERVALALGVDSMFTFGHGDISLFVPGISLLYRPGSRSDEP